MSETQSDTTPVRQRTTDMSQQIVRVTVCGICHDKCQRHNQIANVTGNVTADVVCVQKDGKLSIKIGVLSLPLHRIDNILDGPTCNN